MKIEYLVDNIKLCEIKLKECAIFESIIFEKGYTDLEEYKLDNLKRFIKTL